MTPGVSNGVAQEQRLERQIERQMGCMAGFLQLFDRHHVLPGRRHYSTRRLATCSIAGSTSPSERSEASSSSFLKESHPPPSSPEACPENRAAAETRGQRTLPLPFPVFETKDGARTTWRFREGPRLSLDSRAVVDAKGKLRPREIRTSVPVPSGDQSDASEAADEQRRSPSVVARLMGLDALPSVGGVCRIELDLAELRRSASESRVRRDPSYYGFMDAGSFHKRPPSPCEAAPISTKEFFKTVNLAQFRLNETKKLEPTPRTNSLQPLHRKSFFDAEDFFPEPKQSGTLYVEIEKRLRMRGIDEPAKDLDTLKQILEALHLRGLLHSKPHDSSATGHRNLIYDYQSQIPSDAPIVIMKPASKPPQRPWSEPLPPRPGAGRQGAPPVRRERGTVDRSIKGGNERRNRSPRSPESPSSPVQRRHLNAVAQKSAQPQRRMSTVSSPWSSPKRTGPDPLAVRSPRSRKPTADASPMERVCPPAEADATTIISESSISASPQLDFELLHSIAAFTGAEQDTATDQQPSPVSVLDSLSYLGEEVSPSPSPLAKRSIDFKGSWSSAASTNHGREVDGPDMADQDYAYVCDVLRASDRYGDASDAVYAILEKRRCRRQGPDKSKTACLHRRLVFDTVAEILERKRHVSPWDAFSRAGGEEALPRVWAEFRRVREQVAADDHEGAVRKDIAAGRADGWAQPAAEMSDAVLHIERLIFKDLVAETIRDLADAGGAAERRPLLPRRKLVF
ncbi:hypothetical protein B296_00018967 [Ensete ventricosum]|uniref:DUF4378 domain-containing protein n=1 Tax=Ensete ventricosum TaxID=4639 RepID=A0A427A1T1_ENSVE|nr:hypothetical protein B296_00018967 [Ensete ventricosum]